MKSLKLMFSSVFIIYLLLIAGFFPFLIFAQGSIVPCDGFSVKCDFNKLITLANNIINFLVFRAAPLVATLLVIWAGILLVTARGNSGKMEDAKGFIWKVLIGFIVAGGSFLIIKLILVTLGASGTASSFLG